MSLEKRPPIEPGGKLSHSVSEPGRIIIKHLPLIAQHKGVHEDFDAWDPQKRDPDKRTYLSARHNGESERQKAFYWFNHDTNPGQYDIHGLLEYLKAKGQEIPFPTDEEAESEKQVAGRSFFKLRDRRMRLGGKAYRIRIHGNRLEANGPIKQVWIALQHEEKALRSPGDWHSETPLVHVEAQALGSNDPRPNLHFQIRVHEGTTTPAEVEDLVRLFFSKSFEKRTPMTGRKKTLPPGTKGLPQGG